jgi:hypothetical protein
VCCAIFSPLATYTNKTWYNVAREIRRGRVLKCSKCGIKGATIKCMHPSCGFNVHYQCALQSGWNPSITDQFLCQTHRRQMEAAVVKAEKALLVKDVSKGIEVTALGWTGKCVVRTTAEKDQIPRVKLEPSLTHFTYIKACLGSTAVPILRFPKEQRKNLGGFGCDCSDGCGPSCPCVQSTGGAHRPQIMGRKHHPFYNVTGAIFQPSVFQATGHKWKIHCECHMLCRCHANECNNRVVSHGIKVPLQLFPFLLPLPPGATPPTAATAAGMVYNSTMGDLCVVSKPPLEGQSKPSSSAGGKLDSKVAGGPNSAGTTAATVVDVDAGVEASAATTVTPAAAKEEVSTTLSTAVASVIKAVGQTLTTLGEASAITAVVATAVAVAAVPATMAANSGGEKKAPTPTTKTKQAVTQKRTAPRPAKGGNCCQFQKSTRKRMVLEAECEAKGIAYTPKTTRLGLAALLLPDVPAFCDYHLPGQKSATGRKVKPAAKTTAQKVFRTIGKPQKVGKPVVTAAPTNIGWGVQCTAEMAPKTFVCQWVGQYVKGADLSQCTLDADFMQQMRDGAKVAAAEAAEAAAAAKKAAAAAAELAKLVVDLPVPVPASGGALPGTMTAAAMIASISTSTQAAAAMVQSQDPISLPNTQTPSHLPASAAPVQLMNGVIPTVGDMGGSSAGGSGDVGACGNSIATATGIVVDTAISTGIFEKGAQVEVRYKKLLTYYTGRISRKCENGASYDIVYDDGEEEMGVEADMIRPRRPGIPDGTVACEFPPQAPASLPTALSSSTNDPPGDDAGVAGSHFAKKSPSKAAGLHPAAKLPLSPLPLKPCQNCERVNKKASGHRRALHLGVLSETLRNSHMEQQIIESRCGNDGPNDICLDAHAYSNVSRYFRFGCSECANIFVQPVLGKESQSAETPILGLFTSRKVRAFEELLLPAHFVLAMGHTLNEPQRA